MKVMKGCQVLCLPTDGDAFWAKVLEVVDQGRYLVESRQLGIMAFNEGRIIRIDAKRA